MNQIVVTPTFQSAQLAGWKTGPTKPGGFMAPRRVQCWRSKLLVNLNVGQASRLPTERVSASSTSASPTYVFGAHGRGSPGARDLSRRNTATADRRLETSRPGRFPAFLRTEVRAPFARAATALNRYSPTRAGAPPRDACPTFSDLHSLTAPTSVPQSCVASPQRQSPSPRLESPCWFPVRWTRVSSGKMFSATRAGQTAHENARRLKRW